MQIKHYGLALTLVATLCASAPAFPQSTIEAPANTGRRWQRTILVDPTTGQPSSAAGASQSSPLYASESAPNVATSQATASTTASVICPLRATRRAVTIQNLGTTQVFYGPAGVTTTSGGLLPGAIGNSVTLNTSAAIYGITSAGSQAVACTETY